MSIKSRIGKQLTGVIFATGLLVLFLVVTAASEQPQRTLSEESQSCLKCHGSAQYVISDTSSGDEVTKRMYRELRIDATQHVNSTHGNFKCTDCHSTDYETFPHPVSVKFEANYTCMDCHGGDEAYASFNFEKIETEYNESVHAKAMGENFNCWSCHNPHYYKLSKNITIEQRVAIDNDMCLQCHGSEIRFNNLSDKELPNILEKHDWLPNQALHFKSVRCIDCHAKQNDSIMVAHLIQGGDKAVKNCIECHSSNSILMSSLYKHEVSEQRSKSGFYNSVIMNQAYIIGANRNIYLNIISIAIFGVALLAIAVHIYFRTRKSKINASK